MKINKGTILRGGILAAGLSLLAVNMCEPEKKPDKSETAQHNDRSLSGHRTNIETRTLETLERRPLTEGTATRLEDRSAEELDQLHKLGMRLDAGMESRTMGAELATALQTKGFKIWTRTDEAIPGMSMGEIDLRMGQFYIDLPRGQRVELYPGEVNIERDEEGFFVYDYIVRSSDGTETSFTAKTIEELAEQIATHLRK